MSTSKPGRDRLAPTTLALTPNAYFGTKYSGFQNNAFSDLGKSVKLKVESVTVGVNLGILGFGISAAWKPISLKPPRVLEVDFLDLILFAKDQKSILYDAGNRKIWIVSELSLALQMAHIWAAHETDKDILLSKLPYATPSPDSGPSALRAIMESRQTVLRDHPSERLLFEDLIRRILRSLEALRDTQFFAKDRRVVIGRQVLRGWEVMEIALSVSSTTALKEIRIDKETGNLVKPWTEAHPLALTLVGSNLEPQPPTIPVVLDHIRRITVDTKGNETRDHHTNLDNGSNQSPDVSTRAVESQQATASPASQQPIESSTQISRAPGLVKGNSDDADVASLGTSSPASGRSSPIFSPVTSRTSQTQQSVTSTSPAISEPAIWQLRRLLLGDDDLVVLLDKGVEQQGIDPVTKSLRRSLSACGKDLAKEATTKEQRQAAVFVQQKAQEVSKMIMERFNTHFQYMLDMEQESGKSLAAGDDVLQGLFVPEMAEEDDVEPDEEPTAEQQKEELSSLENVEEFIRHSKACGALRESLAELITTSPPGKGAGKQLATPQLRSVALPIPDATEKDLKEQPIEQQKLTRPKTVVKFNRRLSPPAYGGDEGPIPRGFIQRLDDGHFQVKTRNRCNDIFEDIIAAESLDDAEAFFRSVDCYDRRRGPMRKLTSRLLDLYWTFAPPTHPGPIRVVSPGEGGQNLDAPGQSLEPVAKEPEAARHTPAVVEQELGVDTGSNPDTGPAAVAHDAAAPAQEAPNVDADPDSAAQNNQQNDPHDVFNCLPLGRPGGWRLHHARFMAQAGALLEVTDETMFNKVRTEIGIHQASRGPLRFLFPLRVSKAEYYEFTHFDGASNNVSLDEGLALKGKLPNEHQPQPPPWTDRCPADKWSVPQPNEFQKPKLATAMLTDAVRNPSQFAQTPNSAMYCKYVPWKLRKELRTDPATPTVLGWGFVISFEFDFFVFWCIWGTASLLLSLGLLFGLYVASDGPAHGQPGVAVAVFLAPFGLLGTMFGGAYAYAKQRKYLD